jgi:hypothetical protein
MDSNHLSNKVAVQICLNLKLYLSMGFFGTLFFQKETYLKMEISPENCVANLKQFIKEIDSDYLIIPTSSERIFDIILLAQGSQKIKQEYFMAKAKIIRGGISDELALTFSISNEKLILRFLVLATFLVSGIVLLCKHNITEGLIGIGLSLFYYIIQLIAFINSAHNTIKWVKTNILNERNP